MSDYLRNALMFLWTVCPVAVLVLGFFVGMDWRRRQRS